MAKIWVEEPLYRTSDLFPWQVPDQWALAEHSLEADWLLIRASSSSEELALQQRAYSGIQLSDHCRVQLVNLWWIADHMDTAQYIENEIAKYRWLQRDCLYLHTNRAQAAGFYDILWNRHKFYFTETDSEGITTHWTEGHTAKMYELADIPRDKLARKTFLSPNRIYLDHLDHSPRLQRRRDLVEHLQSHSVYCSDTEQSLEAQESSPYLQAKLTQRRDSIWQPIHNRYYLDSYCSVYVETVISGGETQSITEKTWDPLIKGHFILPYAYCGFRQDLRDRGFLVPPALDLSYLDLADPKDRWQAFLREIDRVSGWDWQEFHRENHAILIYNRQQFWQQPYSQIPV